MFGLDEHFDHNDNFFFSAKDDLSKVCNAPKDSVGVYIVYELKEGRIELVYVGSSGQLLNNGTMKVRKGGLYDRIVNGKQTGTNEPRKTFWKQKLIDEGIDALDIYWFVTFNEDHKEIPAFVEAQVLQEHFELFDRLPRWNKSF